MNMDSFHCRHGYNARDYVGKFLPTKIKLLTKIPNKWKNSESFRQQIWEKINSRLSEGELSEKDK